MTSDEADLEVNCAPKVPRTGSTRPDWRGKRCPIAKCSCRDAHADPAGHPPL